MDLPFSPGQFFEIFAVYNRAVWPMQWVLNGLGIAVAVLLARGCPAGMRAVAGILALAWLWAGSAYHIAFFTAINPAAWAFGALFIAAAVWFARDAVFPHGTAGRETPAPLAWFGWLLMVYALLVYPLLGLALGHRYPAAPTFGLPCPLTIFTIGVLMVAGRALRGSLLAIPLVWSVVGAVAAFVLGVQQDLGLIVAGAGGVLALLRRRPEVRSVAR